MEVIGMHIHRRFLLSIIALSINVANVSAQEDSNGFTAEIGTRLSHDDNIYRVVDALAKDDNYLRVTPELTLIGGLGKQRFEIKYRGDYSKFETESDADYSDHNFIGRAFLDHSLRFKTHFEVNYQKEHEEPGVIQRIQLDLNEYNKYEQLYLNGGFSYGQDSSKGQIIIDYGRYDRNYTNNGLDYLDFKNDQISTRFIYRVAPKTKVYVEAIVSSFDYTPGQNFELDNDYVRYRGGIEWEITNQLEGDINIGYQDRDYQQENLQDITGLAYSGDLNWSINTYTDLKIIASRESIDSSLEQTGGFLRTSIAGSFNHKLSELWALELSTSYTKDELVFTSAREDERYSYQVRTEYNLSRIVNIGLEYTFEERDSTDLLAKYNANVLGLFFVVSL